MDKSAARDGINGVVLLCANVNLIRIDRATSTLFG
jgi:hypothetical protein